jgi:oxygen-independent coproporphyrinogen-3 oxidase
VRVLTTHRGAATGIDHLSDYALTLEGLAVDVPMARAVREGRLAVPDGDVQSDMGLAVRDVLAAAGFVRYEISNFAREASRCAHNLGYWQGRPYLGLGVGAYGATLSRRYGNTREPRAYLAALAEARLPPGESEHLGSDTRFTERVFLGLRLSEGLDLVALAEEFGSEAVNSLRRKALALVDSLLLSLSDERLMLNEAGLDLHSELCARLL